jgi:hypothetical protein
MVGMNPTLRTGNPAVPAASNEIEEGWPQTHRDTEKRAGRRRAADGRNDECGVTGEDERTSEIRKPEDDTSAVRITPDLRRVILRYSEGSKRFQIRAVWILRST